MQKFWSRVAVELGRRAGLVAVLGLLLTLTLGFGITKLTFATGTDSYLNTDDAVYKESIRYQNRFGGEANLTVITMDEGHKVDELTTNPQNMKSIAETADKIRDIPGVRGVITPISALELSAGIISTDPQAPTLPNILNSTGTKALTEASKAEGISEADRKLREEDLAATTARVLAVPEEKRFIGTPEWTNFLLYNNQGGIRLAQELVYPDSTHAMIITRMDGNLKYYNTKFEQKEAARLIKDIMLEHAPVRTSGATRRLVEINDFLRGGMLTLAGIAVAIMVVILLVLFDVRWRLLPLAVVLIGCVWAFGAAGFLGIPLTLVTVAGLPVMLGIGIDYAIQMHARVEEESILDHSSHPIQETARNLCPALLVVTFDAVFAFAALHWAKVPMLRQFGLLLAVGVAVICLASIVLPLASLGIREYHKPTRGKDFSEGFLGRLVVKLGSLPPAAAIPMAVLSILVFLGGISVEEKLKIQTDPVKWINPEAEVIKNLRYAEAEVGGSNELGVFIESKDVFTQEVVDYVDTFTNRYRTERPKDFPAASSIVAIVSDLTVVPGAERVTPSAELVKAALAAAPEDIQSSTFNERNEDGTESLNLAFLTGPSTLDDSAITVAEMRADVKGDRKPPEGATVTPSGLVVVGVGLLENLEANRILLTYLSIAFVAAFLAIRMRSIVRSLLSLVPVLIAVGVASILAWAFKWELSPMTAVGGPLVVAACTEFTSLILLRFVEERGRGLDPQAAVDVTAARTGRAFIVSALTAISGVAVISFSSMPLLRDFGRIVGMNVAVALLSALVVLPPMLVWADNDKRRWVSKGMIKPALPYIDVPSTAAEAAERAAEKAAAKATA